MNDSSSFFDHYGASIFKRLELDFEKSENYYSAISIIRSLNDSQAIMSNAYEHLQKTVKADRGTAGKDCQEVFANFLRSYLPEKIEVIVDGNIALGNGQLSPQIDLILVKDMPKAINKSYIPHKYVLAAFEVKLTLRKSHFKKISKTAEKLRSVTREGTPREELFGKIIYGVMALSSRLTYEHLSEIGRTLDLNEKECLFANSVIKNQLTPIHPSHAIDLLLVSDAFSLCATKTINYSEKYPVDWLEDIELWYHYSLSKNLTAKNSSGLTRLITSKPDHHHMGAFLYRLFLLLCREGEISDKNAATFFNFDSTIGLQSHSWNISALSTSFKNNWCAHAEDETIEWQSIHPY